MAKRQMVFGVICFLVGVLVGIEIAGNLDTLVRLVIIVAIILLCVPGASLPPTKDKSSSGYCATCVTKADAEEAIRREIYEGR